MIPQNLLVRPMQMAPWSVPYFTLNFPVLQGPADHGISWATPFPVASSGSSGVSGMHVPYPIQWPGYATYYNAFPPVPPPWNFEGIQAQMMRFYSATSGNINYPGGGVWLDMWTVDKNGLQIEHVIDSGWYSTPKTLAGNVANSNMANDYVSALIHGNYYWVGPYGSSHYSGHSPSAGYNSPASPASSGWTAQSYAASGCGTPPYSGYSGGQGPFYPCGFQMITHGNPITLYKTISFIVTGIA